MKNQNIIVLTEYTNGNTSTVITFTKNLNLEFIPDEMIVKGMHFFKDGTNNTVFTLSSNLVDYNIMCSFIETDIYSNFNNVFQINKPVNGLYDFTINMVDTGSIVYNGSIAITLEFIQYKK